MPESVSEYNPLIMFDIVPARVDRVVRLGLLSSRNEPIIGPEIFIVQGLCCREGCKIPVPAHLVRGGFSGNVFSFPPINNGKKGFLIRSILLEILKTPVGLYLED